VGFFFMIRNIANEVISGEKVLITFLSNLNRSLLRLYPPEILKRSREFSKIPHIATGIQFLQGRHGAPDPATEQTGLMSGRFVMGHDESSRNTLVRRSVT